jgi:hypothetical protein
MADWFICADEDWDAEEEAFSLVEFVDGPA